jgi:hypothetical protein
MIYHQQHFCESEQEMQHLLEQKGNGIPVLRVTTHMRMGISPDSQIERACTLI